MIITKEWLEEKGACKEGIDWVMAQKDKDSIKIVKGLIKHNPSWANWLLPRLMEYKQYVTYAVYAAELVIKRFEKKYPNDKRPRKAIEAAKKCISDPSEENKKDADAAAAAADAAYAADAAAAAAYAAADAAYAAYAADAAAYAADAARKNTFIKIIKFGLELLKR